MARFRILPTELKFFDWFKKSADTVLEAARVLHVLLIDYRDIESRVAQLTEKEAAAGSPAIHGGDQSVGE